MLMGVMFDGTINDNFVSASNPIIVVDVVTVTESFRTIQEAEDFVRKENKHASQIYRHDGQDWVRHSFHLHRPTSGPAKAFAPKYYG